MTFDIITGDVLKTTRDAVLVRCRDTSDDFGFPLEIWIPRSVLDDGENVDLDDTDFMIAEWFCNEKGLR